MPLCSRLPLGPFLLTLSLGLALPALAQDKAGLAPLDPKSDEVLKTAEAMAAASKAETDRVLAALMAHTRDRALLIDQILSGHPDLRDKLLAEAKVLEGIEEGEARNGYAAKVIEAYLPQVNAILEGEIKLLDLNTDLEALYHLLFDPVCTRTGSGGTETCVENPAGVALINASITWAGAIIYTQVPPPVSPPPPETIGLEASASRDFGFSTCSTRDNRTRIDGDGLMAATFTGPNGECRSRASSTYYWEVERGGTLSGVVSADVVAEAHAWSAFGIARADCSGSFFFRLNGEIVWSDGSRTTIPFTIQWASSQSSLFGSNGTGRRERTDQIPVSVQVQPGDVFSIEFVSDSQAWVDGAGETSCYVRMSNIQAAIGILP